MKLASLKHGGRDGSLIVTSRDLTRCLPAPGNIPTLQKALETWEDTSPALEEISDLLNGDETVGEPLDAQLLAAPLPRAHEWLDASTYIGHVMLTRKARGVAVPESFWSDPLMYQGGGSHMLGPRDPIHWGGEDWGLDMEAEVAIITDDVPLGITEKEAAGHIKLILLVNDISLRGLAKAELAKGFGFVNAKPPTAFSPVAVTPDELGDAWANGKVHLPVESFINGERLGHPNAGEGMAFSFPRLMAHAARTRPLGAGAIIGSGTVCNLTKEDVETGKWPEMGSSCLVERRTLETMANKPLTPWLKPGDRVKIEARNAAGESVFGAIEQVVDPRP